MPRRFGIEIEHGLASGFTLNGIAAAFADAGLGDGRIYPYNRNATGGLWTIKTDGSVSGGGECVSPVLNIDSPEDREQVTRAIAVLKANGAVTDVSAGIHVHIDGAGMDAKQVAAVARIFTKFEDCIYRVATSGWETMRPGGSRYCKPLDYSVAQKIAKARTLEQVAAAYFGDTPANAMNRGARHHDNARYCGVNLASWFYRKTIEFRVFNSSLNPERVQGYIGMCMAMVQDARNGKTRSINKRYALGGMADGTTDEAAARHRFLQVLRYDGDMALEDMERLTKCWKDSRSQTRRACGIY